MFGVLLLVFLIQTGNKAVAVSVAGKADIGCAVTLPLSRVMNGALLLLDAVDCVAENALGNFNIAFKTHKNNRECLAARRLAAVILAAIMLCDHVAQLVNPEVGHGRALDIGKNLGHDLFFFAGTLLRTELVLNHESTSLEESGLRFVFVRGLGKSEELCDSFLDVVVHDVYLLFGYKKAGAAGSCLCHYFIRIQF